MKRLLSLAIIFAVASTARSQTLGTCKIFPSNNPWNQRIDSLPVHPNSQRYIDSIGGSIHLHPDFGSNAAYGIPWVAVNSTQPFVPIIFDANSYTDQSDPGPMPIPLNAPVEGAGVGDAHVLAVDTSNHHLYELYQGSRQGSGWRATSTAIFALDSNNYRPDSWTSCDAAGLPIWPGLVRKYECDAGEIKHAIRFTVKKTSRGWIFPARHHAGSTNDTASYMPMGLRFRLKASFDDSKFTGNAKVIATAMKRYGIIMADNGSNWFITGETNTSWDDNDISQLKAIVGNDFEAVYTGPIRTPNTYTKSTDPSLPIPNDSAGVPQISPRQSFLPRLIAPADYVYHAWLHNISNAPLAISNVQVAGSKEWSFSPMSIPDPIKAGDSLEIVATGHFVDHGVFDAKYVVTSSTGLSDTLDLAVDVTKIDTLALVKNTDARDRLPCYVAPNPADRRTTINSVDLVESYVLTDITGKEVSSAFGSRVVDASLLKSGTYFLRIRTSSGMCSQVVIVQH